MNNRFLSHVDLKFGSAYQFLETGKVNAKFTWWIQTDSPSRASNKFEAASYFDSVNSERNVATPSVALVHLQGQSSNTALDTLAEWNALLQDTDFDAEEVSE